MKIRILGAKIFGGVMSGVTSLAIMALVSFLSAWIAMLSYGVLLIMTDWKEAYNLPAIGFWQMYMISILLGFVGNRFKN